MLQVKEIGPGSAPIDAFYPNPWNPNQMDAFHYAKTVESIKEFGFVDPLTVRPLAGSKGDYEILDGEHRWRAARDAGLERIPFWNVGPIPDEEAKKLTIVLNELRGQYDQSKMGELLAGILAAEPVEEMLKTLPFTEEALRGLIDMADFDWSALEEPIQAKPDGDKTKWVERTFRLPEDAAMVIDQAISKAQAEGGFGKGGAKTDWQALEAICADFMGS